MKTERISKSSLSHAAIFAAAMAVALPVAITSFPAGAQDDPKELIAVQVRDQGHKCDEPKSAEKDEAQSSPDEQAWILECEDASYRVKLIPDMAAEIEQIK